MYLRAVLFWAITLVVAAEPLPLRALPAELLRQLGETGLSAPGYADWQERHRQAARLRLSDGAAEHIAYYLLQTTELGTEPRLDPAAEARRYFDSLPLARRKAFLSGDVEETPFSPAVRRRMDAFWNTRPKTERHRLLRKMERKLGWQPERILWVAFRFLLRLPESADVDALYQQRGLSADPFPPSMKAVAAGLRKVQAMESVLLAGPGAEFASRFGVEDGQPVQSSQPGALLALLPGRPSIFDCVDIREEVAESLAGAPCRASTGDLVVDQSPAGRYDLAVATNLLVYLNDQELALALGNLAQALRPGGCLLHNDPRFAARLFGEAAGIPVVHFESVRLGTRAGREQLDRVVVHCKAMAKP